MTGGAVHVAAPVVRVQDYHHPVRLTLHAPAVARSARAGQFVSLGVEGSGALLRRPYFLAGADGDEVEVDVEVVGPGSRWLAARAPGDEVDVTGPLGTFFPPQAADRRCLLVGDAAVGPLRFLGTELHRRRAAVASLQVVGREGARRLEQLLDTKPAMVYAAGPHPLLAMVTAAARKRGVPCRVALTEAMACGGLGVCWTCVVPVRDHPSTYVRTCVEGPVLDGTQVRWP